MKKESFEKCMDIIKGDDIKKLVEYIESITDEPLLVSDFSLLMCYAAEEGAVNIVRSFLFFEGLSYDVMDKYPLRIAKAKGYHNIEDIIEPDVEKLKEVSTEGYSNFHKKVEEVRDKYLLNFEILRDEINSELEELVNKEIA